jgi:hypothetical protein
MKPTKILSVDWDYFLPYPEQWFDWGHNEGSMFFYELIWQTRGCSHPLTRDPALRNKTALDLIQVKNETVAQFWRTVLAGKPKCVCIVDSHKDMVQFASSITKGPVDVINFDAHHDFHYGDSKCRLLNCGNWVGWMKRKKLLREYTLVYPEWRKEHPEGHKFPKGCIDKVMYGDWKGKPIKADYVFLCRSSCWMPSWCDEQWILLANLLKFRSDRIMGCEYVEKPRQFVNIDWMSRLPSLTQQQAHA